MTPEDWCHQLQFYHELETVDHLFIQCNWIKQVWFWLGQSVNVKIILVFWQDIEDVIHYTLCKDLREMHSLLFLMLWHR